MIKLFRSHEDESSPVSLITPPNYHLFWAFGLVAGSWAIFLLITLIIWFVGKNQAVTTVEPVTTSLSQFASETEFRSYFVSSPTLDSFEMRRNTMLSTPQELPIAGGAESVRYSETNIQVKGVDEPDIVKTDGKNIFLSQEQRYFIEPMGMREIRSVNQEKTQVISAFPIETSKKIGEIEKQGNLLIFDTVLIVLGANSLVGYDVAIPSNPKEIWRHTLATNRNIVDARLVDDQLVIVTELLTHTSAPCPLPLFSDSTTLQVDCTSIWHPTYPIQADTTFTVLSMNPQKGEVASQVSFVGTSGQTLTYISQSNIYVTFTKHISRSEITAAFLLDPTNSLVDEATKRKLSTALSLPISDAAKQVEIEQILSQFAYSMNDDERMKWETEQNNQMSKYIDAHKREIEQTTIAKIALDTLTIDGLGQIPGHPLNQFSLDEYQDNLRVATTVGGRGIGGGVKSANDVYVLDTEMKTVGSVVDMGLEERIYAVRFMGDKGYVVTFKETDPLYVLDLQQPHLPTITGELKIPGYSSYLHPLRETLLVGIGKEDQNVKVSLFDVNNSANPQEITSYILTDYWSEIQNSHHAFLQDEKHQVFFLPADRGGYVFGYDNDELTLVKTITATGMQRALYIDDYLYLISDRKITVVSEITWQTVKTIEW